MKHRSLVLFFSTCFLALNADAQNIVTNEIVIPEDSEILPPQIIDNQSISDETLKSDTIPEYTEEQIPVFKNESVDDNSYMANEKAIIETKHRQRAIDPKHQIELISLSKVLGSMHGIRTLCSSTGDQTYRTKMTAMLDLEAPDANLQKAPLIIAFNEGFRRITSDSSKCNNIYKSQEKSFATIGYKIATSLATKYRTN